MRFCKMLSLLLFILTALPVKAQDYAIEELSAEEITHPRPFSIARVEPVDTGLRLFLSTDNPEAIADLLAAGGLKAQLSDHATETETLLPISFGKAVRCTADSDPVYLAYADPLPDCDGNPPAGIEHFFEVAAVLGPYRDLALGEDPDFLWLIEEQ
jgi:hypothetical protein